MSSTPPSTPRQNNPPPISRRGGRRGRRGRRGGIVRQPNFRDPPPDGKDPGSGYDGPGEDKNIDKKKPEQPDIKF